MSSSSLQTGSVFTGEDPLWRVKMGIASSDMANPEMSDVIAYIGSDFERTKTASNKVAFVTGGSKGIGFEVVRGLLNHGIFVVTTSRSRESLTSLVNNLTSSQQERLLVVYVDVRNANQVKWVSQIIEERAGKLDIVVNNAGVNDASHTTVLTQEIESFDRIIETNLRGYFTVAQATIPLLRASHGGRIINISGGLGVFSTGMTGGGLPAYRISKAGVNALTMLLSQELLEDNITVIAVDPGWVKTDLGGPEAPRSAEEAAVEIIQLALHPLASNVNGRLLREGQIVDY